MKAMQFLRFLVCQWLAALARAGDDLLTLGDPVLQHRLWQRVSETERDGVDGTAAFPMREIGAFPNVQFVVVDGTSHGPEARVTIDGLVPGDTGLRPVPALFRLRS